MWVCDDDAERAKGCEGRAGDVQAEKKVCEERWARYAASSPPAAAASASPAAALQLRVLRLLPARRAPAPDDDPADVAYDRTTLSIAPVLLAPIASYDAIRTVGETRPAYCVQPFCSAVSRRQRRLGRGDRDGCERRARRGVGEEREGNGAVSLGTGKGEACCATQSGRRDDDLLQEED